MEPGKYTEHDNLLYCRSCYNANFREKGVRGGGGADSYKGTGGAVSELETAPGPPMKDGPGRFCSCGEPAAKPTAKFCVECGNSLR